MQTICPNCHYIWDYTGKKASTDKIPAYVSCPQCRANVKLQVA